MLLVRACWGLELRVLPLRTAAENVPMPQAPVIERQTGAVPALHLPWLAAPGHGDQLCLAAAMHAAAHLRFSPAQLDRGSLKPIQQLLLGLLEDARVEMLAIRMLPGLHAMWLQFHLQNATEGSNVDALLRRLSRALIDPGFADPHPWVGKARRLFLAAMQLDPDKVQSLREIASTLGNDLGQMRLQFNPASYVVCPPYRDDNTHLWRPDECVPEDANVLQSERMQAKAANAQLQTTHRDAKALPVPSASVAVQAAAGDGTASHAADEPAQLLGAVAEWDRLCMRYRPDWCHIFEQTPQARDPGELEQMLQEWSEWILHAGTCLRRGRQTWRTNVPTSDGDNFSTDAMIASAIALRSGHASDPRVYLATEPRGPVLQVRFILDTSVSTSTQATVGWPPSAGPLLDAMKSAVALACAALERAGHCCSIVGFCSNTRHFVRLQPVKTDSESIFSGAVLARLAGLTPEWSTRTGAAVRHIASTAARRQTGQLLVLVTDGEPHDIDIHDPSYLLEDLRRAVVESRKRGFAFLSIGLGSGPQPPAPLSSAMTSIRLHGPGQLVAALAKGIAMAC